MPPVIKSILWIILEIFLFIVVALVAVLTLGLLSHFALGPVAPSQGNALNPYTDLVSNFLPMATAVVAAIFFVKRVAFQIPEELLGFTKEGFFIDNLKGWWFGLLLVGSGALLMLLFGQVQIEGLDTRYSLFLGFVLFFIIQSFGEEVVFRSFLIPMIREHLNTFAALIISSILFFVVHIMNPNVSWPGMVNLFLGGILMGLLFLKYKNIWAPTGFHASWNFVQSAFLGFPVSGHDTYSLIDLRETGNDYITGGAFGYEGSFISIAILIIAIVYFLKTDKELLESLVSGRHKT